MKTLKPGHILRISARSAKNWKTKEGEGLSRYICLECGKQFDTPDTVTIVHHELQGGAKEVFCYCPHCGDSQYEFAKECTICGTVIGETQARFGLCGGCEENADKKFRDALKQFKKEEIEYLNNQYDGDYFGL